MKKIFVASLIFALVVLGAPVTVLAQYGGGGVSYSAPTVTLDTTAGGVIKINNGAKTTASTKVTLTMPSTSANQMAVSNDSAFTNVAWETYSATKEWVLTPTAGTKTVYVMFRSSSTGATTAVYKGTIDLTVSETTATSTTTTGTQTTTGATTGATATTVTTATTQTGAAATTETKTTYNFTKYLAVGSSGDEVKELQTALKSLGYFTYTTITGYFGPATEAAVKAFQKAKNLAPYPGWIGPATRAALNNVQYKTTTSAATTAVATQTTTTATPQTTVKYTFTKYLAVGSSGDEVKQLQLKLKELGYFTYDTATGYFGSVTEAAVKAFQKAKNLAPYPGWIGPATRAELNK